MVLATGAAGGGATKADESARHVRTLIALERAITSPRLRLKIAGKVDLTMQAILVRVSKGQSLALELTRESTFSGDRERRTTKTQTYTKRGRNAVDAPASPPVLERNVVHQVVRPVRLLQLQSI